MKFAHYGYQPLWFHHNYGHLWTEMLGHLEIAVHEAANPPPVKARQGRGFKGSMSETVLKYLKEHPGTWKCYQDLADHFATTSERMRSRTRTLVDRGFVQSKFEFGISWVRVYRPGDGV